MRLQNIQINIFEEGDRVLSTEGIGTVIEDQIEITDIKHIQDIKILLDEKTSRFSNRYAVIPYECIILIYKKNKKGEIYEEDND
jgi:hypothetical protein